MFNRISSKLRNRTGGGNGQKDKSFAYGKMHKPGDQSLLSGGFRNGQSEKYSSGPWMGTEEEHEEEEYERNADVSFAESIFPVPTIATGSEKKTKLFSDKSSEASDYVLDKSESFGEHGSKKSWGPHSSTQEQDINIGPAVLKSYEDAEEDFLGEFEEYFENLSVDNIRKQQYPKLDVQRLVYLDYASRGLFSSYQVQEHMRVLLEEGPCLGLADTGFDLSTHVPDAQDRIFQLLNTNRESYSIIFTTGFTAGFRLFGEAFPFQKNTPLLVCQDNHEAICSLFPCASDKGAKATLVPIGESDLALHGTDLRRLLGRRGRDGSGNGLFVFPAQSCSVGVVHSLNWVAEAQQNGWQVLIDASTYLPTGSLDLSVYQPEFVLGSISHLLGYPSGIGFLVVRKGVFKVQTSGYGDNKLKFIPFPSGVRKEERDCLIVDEDDTLNALTFSAVASGLAHLETVGYEAIRKRVRSLTTWLLQTLISLKHKGDPGPPLARVYGPLNTKNRGNVVAFSVLDSTGAELPPGLVRRLAERNNIIISGGQLCSPGVTNLLGKASERVRDIHVFDRKPNKFALVRVSLGPMTNFQDVYRFAQFLSRFRDEDYLSGEAIGFFEDNSQG